MAAAEEKRLLRLYRSYLREHVGQIRAKRRNPSAKAQSARQPVVDASTDRRLKPQNLLLRPDNQTFQREETYPSTHHCNVCDKIAIIMKYPSCYATRHCNER